LRQYDRRAAMYIENIFYKTKKLQMKILLGKSHIALRKCKGNNKNITAGQIKQQGTLDRLIRHDDGYKFLNALRGSPPYFEKAKKDLFAMIRQLGPATLFCSFSSAETQWIDLPLRTEFPVFWEFLGIPRNSQKFPIMQMILAN